MVFAGRRQITCILVLARKPAHATSTILIPTYILSLLISLVYLVKPQSKINFKAFCILKSRLE